MPETLPRIESLTQNVVDTLQGVTTAGGYHCTIHQVTRAAKVGVNPTTDRGVLIDNGVAVYELDPEPLDGSPQATNDFWQPFELVLVVFESERNEYPARRRLNVMRADIIKAMMADINRGGYAEDTRFDPHSWILNPDLWGAADGLIMRMSCLFREDLNDPWILR